jgi:hypothetical protein
LHGSYEYPVAGSVTVSVIDFLEVIQIQQDQGAGLGTPLHQAVLFTQPGEQSEAGLGAGQRILVLG